MGRRTDQTARSGDDRPVTVRGRWKGARVSLLDYVHIVHTRLWVFVLSALLGLGAGGLVVLVSAKQYTARSLVFFASPPGRAAQDLSPGLIFAQGLVRSYAEALTQPLVLDPALRDVGAATARSWARRPRSRRSCPSTPP